MAGHVELAGVVDHVERANDALLERRVVVGDRRRQDRRAGHHQHVAGFQQIVVALRDLVPDVLCLRVVAVVVLRLHVFAEEQHVLHHHAHVVGPGARALRHVVEELRVVEAAPVGAGVVALQHDRLRTLDAERHPHVIGVLVARVGDLGHLGTGARKAVNGGADTVRDHRVAGREPGIAPGVLTRTLVEAFLQHADLDALAARIEARDVVHVEARRDQPPLARIERILAGDRGEHACGVLHRVGHGAEMVHGHLDHHGAGIGHEAIRRLVADDAAPARGNADRAALVAADRHVDIAGRDGGAVAVGRRAGRMGRLVRVAHGPIGRGVAAARERAVLAVGLAEDGPARIEHARHHGGVDVGDIALHPLGAVDHGEARHADRILDADPPAGKHAVRRALDLSLHEPRVVGVFLRSRPVGAAARILHRRLGFLHRVEAAVAVQRARHHLAVEVGVRIAHREAERLGQLLDLLRARRYWTCRHSSLP